MRCSNASSYAPLHLFELARSKPLPLRLEIKRGQRTDTLLEFPFAGVNDAIRGALTTWELNVAATREDLRWDFLLSLEASPKRVPGGYVCGLCPPETRPVFPDRPCFGPPNYSSPFSNG